MAVNTIEWKMRIMLMPGCISSCLALPFTWLCSMGSEFPGSQWRKDEHKLNSQHRAKVYQLFGKYTYSQK
jgi:hypothetical protein